MNNNYNYNYFPNGNYNRMNYDEFFESLGVNNMNNTDMYNDMNNNFTGNNNNNMYTSYEGYVKGNMFSNKYKPYKQYKPMNLNPSNEKEEVLYNLNQKHFAMHEANLYLDVFPNDNEMMNMYIKNRNEYNKLFDEYQSKYGPLCVTDSNLNNIPFGWEDTKFPWERGDK